MKRILYFFLLLSLTLTGCSTEEILKEPPSLTVICGDQQIPAPSGSYGWDYKNLDGTDSSVIADGFHPLDRTAETYTTSETTATLRFGTEPKSISVECWSTALRGNTEAESGYANLKGNRLSLRSGPFVYAVHASWEGKRYRGSSTYVFCIDSTAKEPILTEPPQLRILCGDKSTLAKLGNYSWQASGKTLSKDDAPHPLRTVTAQDQFEMEDSFLLLDFEVIPDRFESTAWYDHELGKETGGNPINEYWSGNRLFPVPGGMIIEIHAFWESRSEYRGDAYYTFYIKST